MITFITIIHVIVCLILIGVVLLQAGKGAEMGAAFGGSSQTIFGSRGSATFLSKLTVGAAVLFMVTSFSLSVLNKSRSVVSTVIDQTQDEVPSPVAPEEETSEAGGGE